MQSSGGGGKDEVGGSRVAPVQRKRQPLKVDQIRRIARLVNEMREQLGDERALKEENFRTLLRLLQAHLYPLPSGSFTFSQRFALKLQVLIFQCLQTRKPLPRKLVDAMESGLTVAKHRPYTPGEKLGPKNVGGDQLESKYLIPPDARLVLRKPDVTVTKPAPIDPALLLEERERLVLSYAEEYERADPKKKKYNISVELLKRQAELRAEIVAEHTRAEEDGRLGSRTRGRVLRGLQRDYERADRTRTKIREQEEAERRQIKTRWMNALHQHIVTFRNSREAVRRAVRSVNRGVLKHHEDVHRIADRAEREAEKKRIQKLKENDEEGYLELVRETKNQRLMEVLKQTDTYLETLSATLKQERIESGENLEEDEVEDDQRKYLEVAHARNEVITEQPVLLEFGQLKEYQREGLQWMVSLYNNRLNGILADEMGLGKTVQTIALLCYLVERKANPGPYLIIVPLATMHNWRAEFERWAPKLQVVVFQGDKKRRKQLFERQLKHGSMNVVLATFEYVILGKGALSQLNWQYIIIDEGHRIKNHESKLSVILAQKYTSRNRLLLTGTPLQNSLGELWALLNFLLPKVFNSCDTFETWFSAPFENMPEGEEAAPKVLSEEEELLIIRRLHRVLQPFLLRRLKSDVLKMGEQLPSKQEDVVVCDMSAWQQHTYDRIVQNEPMVYTNSHGRTCYDRPANPKMQLRKIANHPYLFHEEYSSNVDDGPELWRASGKFDMLDACLQKLLRSGHRVLVFNQMTKIVDLQERLLRYRNIPFLRLDGATKPEDRSSFVKEFNDPATIYNVFLLTTRAGGLGINLQTADTVIIFDSDWNPQADLQAADRAHRIGQQREVRILRFVTAKSVEEDVLERATFKRGLEEKIIQAGMFDDKAKDSERQARLRDLLKDKEEEVRNEKEDLPTPDEINQMLARGDHEIEIFQQVDEERKLEIDNGPALMEENELPDWLTDPDPELLPAAARQDFFNQNGDVELPTQRRAAAKKQVYNIDRLSDEQYLRALEGEPIPESSPMPVPKVATKKRRNEAGPESGEKKDSGRKRRRIAADDDESAPSDSGQSSRGAVDTAGAAPAEPPTLKSPAAKRLHRKASSASSGELSENEMEDIVMEGSVAAGGAALMPVRTGGPQTSDEDAEDGEVEDGEIEEDDGDRDADGEGDVSEDADAGADLDADADVDVNAVIGDGTVAPPEPDEGDDGDEDEEIEIDEVDVAEEGEDAQVADGGVTEGQRTAVTDDEEPPNGRASAKDDTSEDESDRRDGPTGGVDRGSEDDDSESGDDQSYSSEDDRDSN